MNTDRREFLGKSVIGSAALSLGSLVNSTPVFASPAELQTVLMAFTEGSQPGAGKITLTTPEIAENGNGVALSFKVESPMTEDDYVESVMILAEDNPNPQVATFHFSPASGEASASTRIRLARTQNVMAVARLNNGDVYSAINNIKVTIGGCGG